MAQTLAADRSVLQTLGLDRHTRRRRLIRRIIELLVAVAVVTGGILLWRRAAQPAAVHYQTGTVERGDLALTVTATGTLAPATKVDVGPEISGRVRRVLADYNDEVKPGQILVELDTELLEAQAEQAASQVALAVANQAQARAAWSDAVRELARTETLASRGTVSPAELDAARSAEVKAKVATDAAVAQLRTARASASMVRTSLAKATIRSPISGVILSRSVEEGQAVVAALQAPVFFTVAEDLAHMELVVDVDEADVAEVRAGQHATFTVAAHGEQSFDAVVRSVRNSARVRDNVVTYEAVLSVDNTAGLLRPGMTATAHLITESHPGTLTVPDAALRFRPAGAQTSAEHQIWLLQNGRPHALAVKVGASDGLRTSITSDVAVGQAVIVGTGKGGK